MGKERRVHPRLEIPLDVEYIVGGSDEPRRGRIGDLSAGGAALLLPEPIAPKTLFASVRFLLPAEEGLDPLMVDTMAVTAHSKRLPDESGRPGSQVGVRFVGLPAEVRKRISQFVFFRLMRKTLPPKGSLDRRRIPFEQPIAVRFERFDSFVTEVSANISETGMFITTEHPRAPGSVFEFQFTLGDEFTLIEGEAEVAWVRRESAGPSQPSGMGIKFRRLGADSGPVIRRLVNQFVAGGHAPFDLEEEAPDEELSVSSAPPGQAGAAEVEAALESQADSGGDEATKQAPSLPQAEEVGGDEVGALPVDRQELEEKLQNTAAELARVRAEARIREADLRSELANALFAEEEYREKLERGSEVEAELRLELDRAVALQAELRKEFEKLPGTEATLRLLDRRASTELAPRRRDRRALRDVGLLAAGAALGIGVFFYWYSLRLMAGGRGKSPVATVSELASTVAPPAAGEESPQPAAQTGEPTLASAPTVVEAWAAAWSEQRVDDYLAFYAHDFQRPEGQGRSEWEEQRRRRLERPRWVRVTLGSLEQEIVGPGRTRISFRQDFETATYSDRVRKTLELVWEDGAWKILQERSDSD